MELLLLNQESCYFQTSTHLPQQINHKMAEPVLEYFSFHSDFTRTFCCDAAVLGYKPLSTSTHALNDFIADIKTCGEPRRLIDGTKWQTHERDSYNVAADEIMSFVSKGPSALKPNSKMSDQEKGVLQKCIVLVEYFPQSRNESVKKPKMPSMWFGRPLYGRQGQKVWVGRSHPESDEMRTRRAAEVYERSLQEAPGIGEAGERIAFDGEKEQRLSWDWLPGNESEVVQATDQIWNKSREGMVDTKEGVWAQSWECTKCSEGKERPGSPRKKWRFVVYYKNIDMKRASASKEDDFDDVDRFRSIRPRKVAKDETKKEDETTLLVG